CQLALAVRRERHVEVCPAGRRVPLAGCVLGVELGPPVERDRSRVANGPLGAAGRAYQRDAAAEEVVDERRRKGHGTREEDLVALVEYQGVLGGAAEQGEGGRRLVVMDHAGTN